MSSKSQDDMLRTLLREPRLPKLCPELHMPLQREMPQVQNMFFPAVADGFGPFGPEFWEKNHPFLALLIGTIMTKPRICCSIFRPTHMDWGRWKQKHNRSELKKWL